MMTMTEQNHAALAAAAKAYLEDETDEKHAALLQQLAEIMNGDGSVLINAVPILGKEGQADPQGIDGPDGRFYLIIFSDMNAFHEADGSHAMLAKLRGLVKSIFLNQNCGGIAVNWKPGERTVLISKSTLVHLWDESLKEH